MTPDEQNLLDRAAERIREQQALLQRLTAPAYHVGTVVAVFKNRYVVDTGNQLFELDRRESSLNLKVGDAVDMHGDTGQVVRASEYMVFGATGKVVAKDGDLYQINTPSGVVTTTNSKVEGVNVGDKVVMNSSNHVILYKLPEQSQYAFKTQSVLTWDDIGAQEEAKKELIDALETPYAQAALYKFFKKQRVKGCLLWGRPGNGKTLLGRAAAGSLAKMHGKESSESGFIYMKGPEILDKYVGESENRIQEAFAFGKAHFKKFGYPAVLFLDEADAILIRRGMRTAAGMEQTIVPMFNAEMDGIEDSGVFVILATNRADILDPAIIRPGRIDRSIYVAPPTKENAASIFNIHMRDVPVAKGTTKEQLVTAAVEGFYSDKYPLYVIETSKGTSIFNIGNLASGAVIAGIIERASALAINRAIATSEGMSYDDLVKLAESKKCPDGLGVMQEDFDNALSAIQKEQQGLNHSDQLIEFVETGKLEVKSIEVCHSGQKIETKRQESQEVIVLPVPITESKHGAN